MIRATIGTKTGKMAGAEKMTGTRNETVGSNPARMMKEESR